MIRKSKLRTILHPSALLYIKLKMSTPVVTDKWAGNFDCSVCRRKRLVGSEFSKKSLEKYRKTRAALKCKKCVSQQEAEEREAAAARRTNKKSSGPTSSNECHTCVSCQKSLPETDFNRNQLAKKEKARCRKCVEKAVQDEESGRKSSKDEKIGDLKKKMEQLSLSGNVAEKMKLESELSALEAEYVTGLKPIKLSAAGRGSWRRRAGRGRGGSGRGKK